MNRLAVTALLGCALLTFAAERLVSPRFEKADLDRLPKGWESTQTGEGDGSIWKVQADSTGPGKTGYVLTQTAKGPTRLFNVCVGPHVASADLECSVQFKPLSGDIDQGGGLVWRFQDARHYYIARMNPLENNFRVYKVIDGKRIQLATKEDLSAKLNQWHSLSIRHVGDQIECSFNGTKYLEVKDDAIRKPGRVGLWSKADAITSFDALTIKDLSKP